MPKAIITPIGTVFGRLTVVALEPSEKGRSMVRCTCECGTSKVYILKNLRLGVTKSCGCLSKDMIVERNIARKGTDTFAFDDLTGQVFGRLTAIRKVGHAYNKILWECTCSCGNTMKTTSGQLKSGMTQSCGCIMGEILAKRNTTHGMTNTPMYKVWSSMNRRCSSPNDKAYVNYGGRGISVSKEWSSSFMNFYNDMSPTYKHGLSIERIDNDGNYCKENCKWGTRIEQANNNRRNIVDTYDGITATRTRMLKLFNISGTNFYRRLSLGFTPEEVYDQLRHLKKRTRKEK